MRALLLLIGLCALSLPALAEQRVLRVCADPNNLPFSNDRLEGFENRIAAIVARELGARVEYTWWAQRRGHVRNTLKAGLCDLVPGAASGVETMATTRPYYRSTYVFVTRAGDGLDVASLDDPRLREVTVGVQMIGDDFANSPPAHGLARRGIVRNVRGFMVYGDYAEDSPPRRIVEAVATGAVDLAIAWGPLAGFYAARQPVALDLVPVAPRMDGPQLPMAFSVSMGVRRGDGELLRAVEGALDRARAEVEAVLDEYRVPRLPLE